MSDQRPTGGITGNFLVGAAVVVFLGLMGTVVLFAWAVDDGARVSSLVGLVLPVGASMIVTILGLVAVLAQLGQVGQRQEQVAARQEQVARQVDDLANGRMDAKIRAGVADVVKDEHLRDDVTDQLEADRKRRDNHPPNSH